MGKTIIHSKSGAFVELDMPDTRQALVGLGLDERGDVQKFLNKNAAQRMDKFAPSLTGAWLRTVDHTSNPTEIVYKGPRARFLYMGFLMVDPLTGSPWARRGVRKIVTPRKLRYNGAPQRGARWDERMMAAEGDQLTRDVQEYIDGRRNNV